MDRQLSTTALCVNYHETFKIVIALVGFSSLDFISIFAQVDPLVSCMGRKEIADHGGERGRALQPMTREA